MKGKQLIEICHSMYKIEKQLRDLEMDMPIGDDSVGELFISLQEIILAYTADTLQKENRRD